MTVLLLLSVNDGETVENSDLYVYSSVVMIERLINDDTVKKTWVSNECSSAQSVSYTADYWTFFETSVHTFIKHDMSWRHSFIHELLEYCKYHI